VFCCGLPDAMSCQLTLLSLHQASLAYLTDILQCIVSDRSKSDELHVLLPRNWRAPSATAAA
jgi:hypothetical protein